MSQKCQNCAEMLTLSGTCPGCGVFNLVKRSIAETVERCPNRHETSPEFNSVGPVETAERPWPFTYGQYEEGVRVFGPGMPTQGALIPQNPKADRIERHDKHIFAQGKAQSAREVEDLRLRLRELELNDIPALQQDVKDQTGIALAWLNASKETALESGDVKRENSTLKAEVSRLRVENLNLELVIKEARKMCAMKGVGVVKVDWFLDKALNPPSEREKP